MREAQQEATVKWAADGQCSRIPLASAKASWLTREGGRMLIFL